MDRWFILSLMTKLLQKVLARLVELPDEEQDACASILLAEIDSNKRWQQAFDDSHDVLETLADEAMEEHKAGKTTPLHFNGSDKPE